MRTARRAAEIEPFEVMDVLARAQALERAGRRGGRGRHPRAARRPHRVYRHARVVSHVTKGDRVAIEADVPRRVLDRVKAAGGR